MPSTKDIRSRIHSVKNTRKITYAMKLVSAAKLKKAQDAVLKSREYTEALQDLLKDLSSGLSDLSHPLMEVRSEVKKTLLVVIGGSRGLCGGYNTNVHRRIDEIVREKKGDTELLIIGKKPSEYARRMKHPYVASYEEISEDPNSWPFDEISRKIEEKFTSGEFDEVLILFTKFKSALSMDVRVDRLLPLSTLEQGLSSSAGSGSGNIIYEPSQQEVFFGAIPRIFRAKLRQASLDAKASEHGSRMTAMDAATKNAGDLIQKLSLLYNKLRQQGITSELLDIIGGAEAVN